MLQRCTACLGKKNIMGAGMIYHKCSACLGLGYLEQIVDVADAAENVPRKTSKRKAKNDESACQQVSPLKRAEDEN